ncbi:hypothetical protein [Pseudomonas guariconensis]|uniref:hypothetical protein n=1 Tax=Pseudomonas guariconensis TaxID=1288410 RepID=UPI002B0565B7|nr:hypothetical protein [Pseudomonas guariconensis]
MSGIDKRWEGLTHTAELAIGIYYAGKRHKSFTLRVAMAGDLIEAQQAHPNGPLQLVTLEVYRQQLLQVGDIPPEVLTTELLRAELAEADLARIADADAALEKKLEAPNASLPTTGS